MAYVLSGGNGDSRCGRLGWNGRRIRKGQSNDEVRFVHGYGWEEMHDLEETSLPFRCIEPFCRADKEGGAGKVQLFKKSGRKAVRPRMPPSPSTAVEDDWVTLVDRNEQVILRGRLPHRVAEEKDRAVQSFAVHVIFHP